MTPGQKARKERNEAIARAYLDGARVEDLAKQYGKTVGCIRVIVAGMGAKRRMDKYRGKQKVVVSMIMAGKEGDEIVKETGLSKATVYLYAKTNGLSVRFAPRPIEKRPLHVLFDLVSTDDSYTDIARRHECTRERVRQIASLGAEAGFDTKLVFRSCRSNAAKEAYLKQFKETLDDSH